MAKKTMRDIISEPNLDVTIPMAAVKLEISETVKAEITDWTKVRYFKPSEFHGHADKIKPELVYALDALRHITGRKITINNAYRAEDLGSTHSAGEAADIVIEGLSVLDQFLIAEKMGLFRGIGIYPGWNRPGLHVDVRQLKKDEIGKRWIRDKKENYIALNAENIRIHLA